MSLILVAKKSGKQVDLSKVVKNGKYTELAVPGEEYYVIDSETGKTPADIEVSRSGDDLIIKSPEENITVVIDEFWHDCTPETQCYAIFDVPAVDGLEAGQVTVTQVGPDVSAFKPGMVGILPEGHTVSPWIFAGLGAAALLGGLAGGSGGGGGGSSQPARDTTAPEIKDGSLDVSGDGKHVSGKTEPGATITVKDGNTVVGTGKADQNGNFDVVINPPKTNGETLTVTAQDKAGNTSDPETVKADDNTAPVIKDGSLGVSGDGKQVAGQTEPGATVTVKDGDTVIGTGTADEHGDFNIPVNPPKTNGENLTVTAKDDAGNTSAPKTVAADDTTDPEIKDGSLDVTDDGKHVTGKTEPGATVTVKDGDTVIGTGTADEHGDFNIPVNPPKTNGENLTVTAKDDAGNTSAPKTVEADDTTVPNKPTNLDVSDDGTKVTGTAEPGSTVVIRDENGNQIGSAIADSETGKFEAELTTPKIKEEQLTATATDSANNTSEPASVTAPDKTPPTLNNVTGDGTHISGDTEPYAEIVIKDGNTIVGTGSADDNGHFEIDLSTPKSNGETLIVTAQDDAGNPSNPATVVAGDTTPPSKPTDLEVSEDGTKVAGTAEPGSTVVIRDENGNQIGSATADPETGKFEAELTTPKINKERLTATATDGSNNTSEPASATAPDKTPPVIESAEIQDPTIGTTVIGKTEPGATVVVKDAEGNPLANPVIANSEGEFTVTLNAPQLNGETLQVVATDDKDNSSSPKVIHAEDLTAPTGSVSVQYEQPSSGNQYNAEEVGPDGTVPVTVSFTDAEEGAILNVTIDGESQEPVQVTAENKETGIVLQVAPGAKVTATLTDNNNIGNSDSKTVPTADLDAPTVTPNISFESTGADDIYNKAEVGEDGTVTATVTVTGMQPGDALFINGTKQTVTPDGGGNATVTLEVNPGAHVKAYVQDAAGNKGPVGEGTAPNADVTPPLAPTKVEFSSDVAPSDDVLTRNEIKDGKVPVKVSLPAGMEEGDTVTVTPKNGDAAGTPVTQPITKADTVNGFVTVSVPVGVNAGEEGSLSVTASFTDKAGNKGPVTNPVDIDVNRKIVGTPSIKYDSDVDDNGVLTGTEIASTTKVTLYLPNNIDSEDNIAISVGGKTATVVFDGTGVATGIEYNGQTYTLTNMTPEEGQGYKVTIADVPVSETATEVASSINIQFSDSSLAPRSAEESIVIDRALPGGADGDHNGKGDGAPEITSIPDAFNPSFEDDGIVNAAELKDGVLVNIKLPEGVQAGDIIVLKNNGTEIYSYPIPSDKNTDPGAVVEVTIPKEKFVDGQTYSITASVKEPYETGARESADSDPVSFTVDTSVPGDSNNDGVADTGGKPSVEVIDATGDGKVGTSDLDDGLQVKVTLPPHTNPGDTVVVTLTKPDGTTQEFPVKTGNGPNETPIANDGTVTITIPKDSLPKDDKGNVDDGTYKVTATVKDDAGNTSLPSDQKSFDVDTIIPGDTNGDGKVDSSDNTDPERSAPSITIPEASTDTLINASEFKDGVQVEVKLPTGGVEVGDKVVLTVTPPNGETAFEVPSSGLTQKQIGAGVVTVTIPKDKILTVDGSDGYKVTAVVKDSAGNTSAISNQENFTVDAQVPGDSTNDGVANSSDTNLGKPLVAIPENVDGVNAQEFADGVGIQVTPPVNTKPTDTVVITITPKDGGEPIVLTQAAGGNSPIDVNVPKERFGTTPEGEYTVTAQVKDAAGNESAVSTGVPLTILDTVVPGDTDKNGVVDTGDLYSKPVIAIAATVESATGAGDAGKVTAAELKADNGVKVTVTLPSGVEPGDIIVIKNDGADLFSYTIPEGTKTDQGTDIVVTVPKDRVPDGDYKFTATVKEPAGTNETAASNEVGFSVDATVPGDSNHDGVVDGDDNNAGKPKVTIPEATNGVNATELDNGVQVTVSLPTGTQVGDRVTLTVTPPEGEPFTVVSDAITQVHLNTNSIPVTIPKEKFNDVSPDGDYSVTAQIKDDVGNASAVSDSTPFTIDVTKPAAPTILVKETGAETPGAAIVNASELNDGVDVAVTLTEGAKAGDTITVVVTPNGKPAFTFTQQLESDVAENGVVTVNVPRAKFPAGTAAEGTYGAVARVTDAAGNVGPDSAKATFTVDVTVPGDTNGDGIVNDADKADGAKNAPSITIPEAGENKLVNAAEFRDGVQVEVTLPTAGVKVGDTVLLTVTPPQGEAFTVESEPLTSTTGTVTVTIPKDSRITSQDGTETYSVTAVVKDSAGNTSATSNSAEFIVDTQLPGAPGIVLAEGTPQANSNSPAVINGNELSSEGGIKVTVTLPRDAKEGDTIQLVVQIPNVGNTGYSSNFLMDDIPALTAGDLGKGSINITIPEAEIRSRRATVDSNAGEEPYTVTARLYDPAGNRSSSQTVKFAIDTKAPSTDGLAVSVPENEEGGVNASELNDNGVEIKVTLPTGIQPGDKVNVTVKGPNGETIPLDPHTVVDGETAGDQISFIIPADKLKQDGKPVDGNYTVTATVSDSVDNTSQEVPSSFTLDTTVPAVTAVSFASDTVPANGTLTNNEISNDNTVPVHITLSEAIKAGDVIHIFTSNDVNGTYTEVLPAYSVTEADIGKTELDIKVPVGVAEETTGTLAVKAYVVDNAGNTSATSTPESIAVDRTHSDLAIQYRNDADSNGLLIDNELSGSSTPVDITLPTLYPNDGVSILINGTETKYTVSTDGTQLVPVDGGTPLTISNHVVTVNVNTAALSAITTTVTTAPVSGGDGLSKTESVKLDASPIVGSVTVAVPEAANPDLESDGKITASELNSDGGVLVNVTLPDGVQVGDIIVIKDGSNELVSYTIQPTDPTTGTIGVTIPSAKLGNGSHTISATVKEPYADGIARSVDSSNSVSFTVDATAPGGGKGTGAANDGEKPVVVVTDDSLTKTEFDNGVSVKVTLPTGTQVGDTVILKVTGGDLSTEGITYSDYTVKSTDLQGTGAHVATITIPKASLPGVSDGDYTVTAQVKDSFGNASPVSDPDNFTVDITAPGGGNGTGAENDGQKPTVEVTDDLLNKKEFDNGVTVKVTLPEGTQVGDTVILKVEGSHLPGEGITYTEYTVKDTDLPTDGDSVATITIPKASLPNVTDGDYTITAQVKDDVDQLSPESAPDNFTVDTLAPEGLSVVGNNTDGSVAITIPADATKVVVTTEPAGEVTLTKGENDVWTSTNADAVPVPVGNGPFTTTIPGNQVNDGSTVTVAAEDKAGNTATATTTAPDINDAPVLTLTKDSALGESFTAGQATAGTKLATASATDADGDEVTFELVDDTAGYYHLDAATGEISLTSAGAAFVNAGGNLPNIQVKATDVRTGSDSLSDTKSLDLPDTVARDESNTLTANVDPNTGATVTGETDAGSTVTVHNAKGELVGTATAGEDGSFTVTLTRTVTGQDADHPSQTISVDTDGNGTLDKEVTTDAQGNFSYTVNNPIVTGEQLTVKSVDPNGNEATATPVTPDKTAPTAPVIAISDDGKTITGTAEPGSTITLTVKDSAGDPMADAPYNQTINVGNDGTFIVDLSTNPLTDKETVTATATDGAGNISPSSNEVVAPFINDSLTDITINLTNDTGSSAVDNITNDGSLKLSEPSAGAVITRVEYKGDDGQYHEIALGENGAYVLPEGVYEAGEIRVTQQDANGAVKYSTNSVTFEVDTTPPAPATAVRDVSSGNVVITLPASAEEGDTVQVFVGNKEVTLTRGADGTWASNNSALVNVPAGTVDGGQIVISASETIPSGTGVSVQSFDVAGNAADKDSDNFVLDPNKLTVVFTDSLLNSDLSNNTASLPLLNAAELQAAADRGQSTSVTQVRVYLPQSAAVGDVIKVPFNDNNIFRTFKLTQTHIDQGYYEIIPGKLPFQLPQGTDTFTATLYGRDGTTVKDQDDLSVVVDKYAPYMPTIESQQGGAVQINLPTPTAAPTIPNPVTGIGMQVADGDWVIVTAGDQSVKLIRENGAWKEETDVSWLTINGTKATISQGNFDYGTTITAQAFDSAGNKSAIDTGHVVQDPLRYTGFRITNTDKNASTSDVVDTNDGTIRYEATISGQEDKEAMILVQLVNSGNVVVNQQYLDITADKTTYTGAFTGLVADSQEYHLRSSIVDKATKASLTNSSTLPQRNADFILDNVAPKIESITLNKDNSLTVMVSDGAKQVTDTASGATVTTVVNEPMTLDMSFGDTSKDKLHVITDPMGNTVAVSSPKLDWLMRYDDDNSSDSGNAKDHASGWSNSGRWFTWNGSDTAADTIIAAHIQTDEYYKDSWKQGLIGTEDGYMGWVHAFDVNTRGGGNDYIQSSGIAGYTRIYTNDGDDKIVTNFMIGTANTFKFGDFDGSSQIYMGSGNDSFSVNGRFQDAYYQQGTDGSWAGLFKTNVKIDMGDGNDTVNIANGIYAGTQQESGNYFDLGAGDDTMTTGTISSEIDYSNFWQGSNIINLGKGKDTLTVNGNIESAGANGPARFLLYSEDSSTVTITGDVKGSSSMLMGDGDDVIKIQGNVTVNDGDNELYWVGDVFNKAGSLQSDSDSHYGFYGPSFYGDLPSQFASAIARGNAIDDTTGGNLGLHKNGLTALRFDLGNGNNTFEVKGSTNHANIVGGSGSDSINLGKDASSSDGSGINYKASVNDTHIATADGNDYVLLVNVNESNYVNTGSGNDSVEIHSITGKWNEIVTGSGSDTVTIYGTATHFDEGADGNRPYNKIDLGYEQGNGDYDVVKLATNGDSSHVSEFTVGASAPGMTHLANVEEVIFDGKNARVNIKGSELGSSSFQDVLFFRAGGNMGEGNKVDIDDKDWTQQSNTKTIDGVEYYEYHANSGSDIVYIEKTADIQII